MSKRRETTIVLKHNDRHYKMFKAWLQKDGSYYVTVPYTMLVRHR